MILLMSEAPVLTEESYKIKVPAFEGPLDLLLHLIRENKIDIYDIPIALITHQYLEYIDILKELNLDIAGEFLLMAATLIHIKSRMLLPIEETVGTLEDEDPRFELVQRLIEYQAFKYASLALREKEDEWSDVFYRKPVMPDHNAAATDTAELALFDLSLFDLMSAFKRLLDKAPPEILSITRETLTVKDRIAFILENLENSKATKFEDLFAGSITRTRMVVTFIALLEILKLGLARVYQDKEFGTIWIMNQAEETELSKEAPFE